MTTVQLMYLVLDCKPNEYRHMHLLVHNFSVGKRYYKMK